jgi:hypothetical protein
LNLGQVEFTPKGLEDFHAEECNLAFVVFLEVEEAVAPDATTSDAFDLIHFDHGILAWGLPVMAEEPVPRRNENSLKPNLECGIHRIIRRTTPARRPNHAAV